MNFFKRIISVVVILAVVLSMSSSLALAASNSPGIKAETAVIYNGNTGEVLWQKDADKRMEPADITILMTALLAVENLDLGTIVTVGSEVEAVESSEMGLLEGEEISVRDLVYAAVLCSKEDAAMALAIETSGSVGDFATLMNQKAKELGCENTNFINASGKSQDGQYSTALDLAIITKAALSNQELRLIAGSSKYTIPETNLSEKREIENANPFLTGKEYKNDEEEAYVVEKYKGSFGGKVGSSSSEYAVMATGLEIEEIEFYSVVLGTTTANCFDDMKKVMDFAKTSISKYVPFKKGEEFGTVKLKGGATNKVTAIAAKEGFVNLPEGASASLVTTKCIYSDTLTAPIEKGQKIGVVEIYLAEDLCGKVDLVAAENIEKGWFLSVIGITNFQTILIGVVIALVIIFAITILVLRIKNKRRQAELRKQRIREEARRQLEREEDLRRRNWHF